MRVLVLLMLLCSATAMIMKPRIQSADAENIPSADEAQSVADRLMLEHKEGYWTEERLASAKPLELPTLSREEYIDQLRLGQGDQPLDLTAIDQADPALLEDRLRSDRFQLNSFTRPYWNVGKIYYNLQGEARFCTGQFIGNFNILTSAECIFPSITKAGREFPALITDALFAARNSALHKIVSCVAPVEWTTNRDRGFDYAVCTTASKSSFGVLGVADFDPLSDEPVVSVGFTEDGASGGHVLYGQNGLVIPRGRSILELQNGQLNEGSRGGAWIDNLSTSSSGGNKNLIISLNSFKVPNEPSKTFGPRIDVRVVSRLLDAV